METKTITYSALSAIIATLLVLGGVSIYDDDVYYCSDRGIVMQCDKLTKYYGLDNGNNLGELLTNIGKINGSFRVRVGMMNPYTCLKNINPIVNGFKSSNIYKFLHLPVQSGDNEILEKMNRKNFVEDFLKIIKKFREAYLDITISTDIIVGFPTETNDQFQHTINLLKTAIEEMGHVEILAERILFLKGEVEMGLAGKVEKIHELKKMIELGRKMEEESARAYNQWANECSTNADSASKQIFENLVLDEERHFDQYDTEVDNLEKFGDRYLALQSIERSKNVSMGMGAE